MTHANGSEDANEYTLKATIRLERHHGSWSLILENIPQWLRMELENSDYHAGWGSGGYASETGYRYGLIIRQASKPEDDSDE